MTLVPGVQRLNPIYENELNYKRNDRAVKWMSGYFAMDVEYLFVFKSKGICDRFKSAAYFQESLYTMALTQHVQGMIPLKNRRIKELDQTHPACKGGFKKRYIFSLKTTSGEFFLSTQYSIQMDDWLDAFKELYKLELQESRQGAYMKRRKYSNSFGAKKHGSPSTSPRAKHISPPNSISMNIASKQSIAVVDDNHRIRKPPKAKKRKNRKKADVKSNPNVSLSRSNSAKKVVQPPPPRNLSSPEKPEPIATKSGKRKRAYAKGENVSPVTVGYYSMVNVGNDGISGFKTASILQQNRRRHRKESYPVTTDEAVIDEYYDEEQKEDTPNPPNMENLPPPPHKNVPVRSSPFAAVDARRRSSRRMNKAMLKVDTPLYDISSKHMHALEPFKFQETQMLREGEEQKYSSTDDVIRVKISGVGMKSKRKKSNHERHNLERNRSSSKSKSKSKKHKKSKSQIKRDAKQEKKRIKAEKKAAKLKAKEEKQRLKEVEKQLEKERKEREKKGKIERERQQRAEQTRKKMLEKKKKKQKKNRRRSVGDVLKSVVSGNKTNVKKDEKLNLTKSVSIGNSRMVMNENAMPVKSKLKKKKKKKEKKDRRRSLGDAIKDALRSSNSVSNSPVTPHLPPPSNIHKNIKNKVRFEDKKEIENKKNKEKFDKYRRGSAHIVRTSVTEKEDVVHPSSAGSMKGRTLHLPNAHSVDNISDGMKIPLFKANSMKVISEENSQSKVKKKGKNQNLKVKKKKVRRQSVNDILRSAFSKKKKKPKIDDMSDELVIIAPITNRTQIKYNKRRKYADADTEETSDRLLSIRKNMANKNRKRMLVHRRRETPQYDMKTKNILKGEYAASEEEKKQKKPKIFNDSEHDSSSSSTPPSPSPSPSPMYNDEYYDDEKRERTVITVDADDESQDSLNESEDESEECTDTGSTSGSTGTGDESDSYYSGSSTYTGTYSESESESRSSRTDSQVIMSSEENEQINEILEDFRKTRSFSPEPDITPVPDDSPCNWNETKEDMIIAPPKRGSQKRLEIKHSRTETPIDEILSNKSVNKYADWLDVDSDGSDADSDGSNDDTKNYALDMILGMSEESDDDDDDDSLTDNEDSDEEINDVAAYVQLNNNDQCILPEGNEFENYVEPIREKGSFSAFKYSKSDFQASENDEPAVTQQELNSVFTKLKNIPKINSKKENTESRIIREWIACQTSGMKPKKSGKHKPLHMMYDENNVFSENIIFRNIAYPNIYQWNVTFIGPQGTAYFNGKYKIEIHFNKDFPSTFPEIIFKTKIYNSSIRWNKKKKKGLLHLPKFFFHSFHQKMKKNKNMPSVKIWLIAIYEFIFFYAGDHYFDPMNIRISREFKFSFDTFVDTCYQWNLLFANAFSEDLNMLQLTDVYGERQKLTYHVLQYANQISFQQYSYLKERVLWPIFHYQYNCTWMVANVIMDYFGNEMYYCALSQIIRHPHMCVQPNTKCFANIINW